MILYHASTDKQLSVIKPQPTLSHDKYIGDFVFATVDKKMALMYLVPKGIPTLMNPKGRNPNIVMCTTVSDFVAKDGGGAIYELPGKDFVRTPQEGLSDYEMVSRNAIKPLRKEVYANTLDALAAANITIRFTDEATFNKLIKSPQQASMIEALDVYRPDGIS